MRRPLAVTPSCANVQIMMGIADAVTAGGNPAKHSKRPELAQHMVTLQSLVRYAYLFVVTCEAMHYISFAESGKRRKSLAPAALHGESRSVFVLPGLWHPLARRS